MKFPRSTHLEAVYQNLRYFEYVAEKGLLFSNTGHMKIIDFTCADWARSMKGISSAGVIRMRYYWLLDPV